jgi:hypothetical protein
MLQFPAQLYRWMRFLTLLFIFLLPLWPNYAELRPFGLPNIAPTRMLNLLLACFFVVCFFVSREAQELFVRRIRDNWRVFVLLGLLYLFKAISAFRGPSTIVGVYEFIKLDILVVLPCFFYALMVIKGREDVRRVMLLLVVSAALVSIITLIEAVLKRNLYTMFLPIASAAMKLASVGGFRDSVYRAQGSFEHPLALSEFLSAVLPLALFLIVTGRRSWQRVGLVVTIGLMCAAIYLTRSRAGAGAGAFALVLLILVYVVRRLSGAKNYIMQYLVYLQIPALLCSLALAGYGYKDYFVGKSLEEQRSTYLRVEMMDKGLPLVMQNPLIGLGAGRGSDAVGIKAAMGFTTIDNYYLALALDAGVPAVALFLLFLSSLMYAAWRLSIRMGGRDGLMAAVLGISILVFMLHAAIQALTAVFPILFLFSVLLMALRADVDDQALNRGNLRK